MIESLVMLVLWLAVLGLIVYLVETFIPMSPPFKIIIRVIVVIIVILLLLNFVGMSSPPVLRR